MNEKLDYKFGKYDLDFLIKLKAHEFRKQKIDNISEKEIRNYLFNIKWKSQKSLPMCDIIDDVMNLQFLHKENIMNKIFKDILQKD